MFLKRIVEIITNEGIIIYIDESSFSNIKHNFKTWVHRNRKEFRTHPGRIKSVSLMLAVTMDKIIHYEINTNTNTSQDFLKFLQTLDDIIELDNYLKSKKSENLLWILADNCKIHKTEEIRTFIRKAKLNIIYIVPYSPQYNLVEFIFSVLKRRFYERILLNR